MKEQLMILNWVNVCYFESLGGTFVATGLHLVKKENSEHRFEVEERVVCIVQFNNPGYHKRGDKLPGTVINVCSKQPTYRIELDQEWGARHPHLIGQKIIVGNIGSRFIEPLP
jgi:hypothetical protein